MTREEAIKEIRNELNNTFSTQLGEAFCMAIDALEKEPKTGHWEWLTEDKYRCSNCNHETIVDECMNKPMYDFCPFCSADMREE